MGSYAGTAKSEAGVRRTGERVRILLSSFGTEELTIVQQRTGSRHINLLSLYC